MENPVELISENKKVWVAPELKKVGVEQITASNVGSGSDGGSFDPTNGLS
jgi:hypothetical protein